MEWRYDWGLFVVNATGGIILIYTTFSKSASAYWLVDLCCCIPRLYFQVQARRTIKADQEIVDQAWHALVSDPSTHATLIQLQSLSDARSPRLDAAALLRHRTWSNQSASASHLNVGMLVINEVQDVQQHADEGRQSGMRAMGGPDNCADGTKTDVCSYVTCLDQLCFQAVVVTPMFIEKMQILAEASGGCLLGEGEGAGQILVPWEDAAIADARLQGCMHWTPTKSADTAIGKAIQKFEGDPSFVVDLVEQIIVFDNVDSQMQCLRLLDYDQGLRVLRVQNTQTLDQEPDEYCMRSILVFLVLSTPAACDIGVSGHVCQLRLVLKDVWSLFDAPMLARYQAYRRSLYMKRPIAGLPRCLRSGVRHERASGSETIQTGEDNELGAIEEGRAGGDRENASSASTRGIEQSCTRHTCPKCLQGTEAGQEGEFWQGVQGQLMTPRIRAILQWKCSWPGDALHRKLYDCKAGFASAGWASIFFSSNPITSSFAKWQFRVINLFCGLACMFQLLKPGGLVDEMSTNNFVSARHFRFAVTQPRHGINNTIMSPGIGTLSLMRDGCPLPADDTLLAVQDASAYLSVRQDAEPVSVNGFAFRTAGDEAFDPVGFEFSACKNISVINPIDCDKWSVVGSSECLFGAYSLRCFVVKNGIFATSTARNVLHQFDLRSPLWHSLHVILRLLFISLGMVGSSIIGYYGYLHTARRFYAWVIFFGNGLINGFPLAIGHFVQYAGTNQAWTGFYPLFGAIIFGLYLGGVCLMCEEMLFKAGYFSVFGIVSLTMSAASVLEGLLLYHGGDYWMFTAARGAWIEVLMLLLAWLLITFFRRGSIHQARKGIKDDVELYDSKWNKLIMTLDAENLLQKLQRLTELYGGSTNMPAMVQHSVLPGGAQGSSVFRQKRLPAFQPRVVPQYWENVHSVAVSSLDQLYLQAQLSWPVFNEFVIRWAANSGGQIDDGGCGELVPVTPGQSHRISGTPLKGVRRAVEKAQRSYHQDVSRLVDVVRQSIVFPRLEDLCTCLEMICQDESVRIVRIKNRLACDHPSDTSGGYRDVAVNLLIENEETISLGVRGHVYELQLLLEPFYRLKSVCGHKRYVTYRNMRAE